MGTSLTLSTAPVEVICKSPEKSGDRSAQFVTAVDKVLLSAWSGSPAYSRDISSIRKVIAAIKAWLLDKGLSVDITQEDIVAFALAAVKRETTIVKGGGIVCVIE